MDKLVLALSCMFEIYIIYSFFESFFNINTRFSSYKKRFVYIMFIVLCLFVINCFNNAFINLFFVPILLWIFTCFLFDGNKFVKFTYFFIAYCLLLGSEFLFAILIEVPSKFLGESSFVRLSLIPLPMLTMKLFTYILFLVVKQIPRNIKKRMNIKIFVLFLLVPITSLGIMILVYYIEIKFESNTLLKTMLIFCFVLMILGNILVFYGFNRYSESLEVSIQQKIIISKQEMDLKYYEQINVYNRKYREFIHNTNHYLKAIAKLAYCNQDEQILGILNELQIEFERTETIMYCDNPIINTMLSEWKTQAEKVNVAYDVYIEPGFTLNVADADLVILIGNLIDNAVMAAQKCEEQREVIIRMFMQNECYFSIIKIINNYCEEIKLVESRLQTTKKNKEYHGIGVESVKNTAEKYGGYMEYFIEPEKFTSILVLPNMDT